MLWLVVGFLVWLVGLFGFLTNGLNYRILVLVLLSSGKHLCGLTFV